MIRYAWLAASTWLLHACGRTGFPAPPTREDMPLKDRLRMFRIVPGDAWSFLLLLAIVAVGIGILVWYFRGRERRLQERVLAGERDHFADLARERGLSAEDGRWLWELTQTHELVPPHKVLASATSFTRMADAELARIDSLKTENRHEFVETTRRLDRLRERLRPGTTSILSLLRSSRDIPRNQELRLDLEGGPERAPERSVMVASTGLGIFVHPPGGPAPRPGGPVHVQFHHHGVRYAFDTRVLELRASPVPLMLLAHTDRLDKVESTERQEAVELPIEVKEVRRSITDAEPAHTKLRATVVGLSSEDATLDFGDALPEGAVLCFDLPLGKTTALENCLARVERVHLRKTDRAPRYVLAVAFKGMSEGRRYRIRRFLRTWREHKGLMGGA